MPSFSSSSTSSANVRPSASRGDSRIRRFNGDSVSVGPDSVGFRLTEAAQTFGGEDLTTTDVAVVFGRASFGDASRVRLSLKAAEAAVLSV